MTLRGALRSAQHRANRTGRTTYVYDARSPYAMGDDPKRESWSVVAHPYGPIDLVGRPYDCYTVVPA